MRSLGFEHTIMVDAPNWGQDWGFVMRDTAQTVRNADATGNIIFAIHMYGVFDTAAEVNAYVDSFTSRNLALCICEFGDNHSDGNPNEDAIMAKAEQASIGMMGWSWSGNGGGVEYLDMVIGFNPAQRSNWGNRFITGANGLSTTSREATIYSGGTSTTNPPQPPGTPGTPTASGVTSSSVSLSWAASSGTVTNYQIERATGATSTSFTQVGTSTTTSFTNSGLAANTTYRYRVRATNSAGNSGYSGITNVTTTGTTNPQPPGTPGTLSASGTTSSATTLSWGASSGTVTNYQIERATGATSTTFSQVGTSTSTTFTNTGLAANTTYRYRVRATNSAGNSGYSNIVNVTTSGGTTPTGGCSATYRQVNSWPGGFQGEVTVTNTGTNTTTGWTVVMTFANGQTVTQVWGGLATVPASSPVAVRNESWNGSLGPNASTNFGFLGSWNGTNNAPTVTCSRTP
jgi:mannan endo-1,4-beta-mannosidase